MPLDRQVSAADVMRNQFDHLLDLSARPNIEIQIAPTALGSHQGMTSVFWGRWPPKSPRGRSPSKLRGRSRNSATGWIIYGHWPSHRRSQRS